MPRLGLLFLLMAVTASHAVAQTAVETPVVTVTGTAEISVPPDAATLSIMIQEVSPSPSEAASETSGVTSAVRAALKEIGIAESAVRQTDYWVGPNWVYPDSGRTLDGYAARLEILVETQELSQVGEIVHAAVGAGAWSIGQIEYTSTTLPQARREALSRAVEQARLDAEAVAEAAGGELGALQYLTTEDGRPGVTIRGGSARPRVEMATPKDLTIEATVRGQWTLVIRH